jgi:UDPglucose 6-dehydrogenase
MSNLLIVGSGVVGQATGKGFIRKGHRVSFVDVNPSTIDKLRSTGFDAMTMRDVDWNKIDIVMLAVSTPTVDDRIVLDYIESAAWDVGKGIGSTKKHLVVVVRSTVPPTTTAQRIKGVLETASGKIAGDRFSLAMNPEFLRQATSEQDFDRPWVTVIGAHDERAARVLKALYLPFKSLIVECTPTEAEMIKYVSNIYNAVKISYFNEVHAICEKLGIDSGVVGSAVARTAESMWNPLYGTRGGVPFGGACLPKDTSAFLAFCHDQKFAHLLLEATVEANRRLAESVPPASKPDEIDKLLHAAQDPQNSNGFNTPHVGVNGKNGHHHEAEVKITTSN